MQDSATGKEQGVVSPGFPRWRPVPTGWCQARGCGGDAVTQGPARGPVMRPAPTREQTPELTSCLTPGGRSGKEPSANQEGTSLARRSLAPPSGTSASRAMGDEPTATQGESPAPGLAPAARLAAAGRDRRERALPDREPPGHGVQPGPPLEQQPLGHPGGTRGPAGP